MLSCKECSDNNIKKEGIWETMNNDKFYVTNDEMKLNLYAKHFDVPI